jgi:antitoxin (DNA-binding transcriptional repressor) of toxin-antitoxin stability system
MKNHFMEMYQELEDIQSFTVQEFQSDFDNLMSRVENGESFIIRDGDNSAVIVPYNETIKYAIESVVDEELIDIHTDHEEGS